MINQSTGLINTLQYKIAGLCYLKSFNPRHFLLCYNNISLIISAYCQVCFTVKAEKNISWFIVENKEELLIYLTLK
jgi:hypothetical protein